MKSQIERVIKNRKCQLGNEIFRSFFLPKPIKHRIPSYSDFNSITFWALIMIFFSNFYLCQSEKIQTFIQNESIDRNLNHKQTKRSCYIGFINDNSVNSGNQLSNFRGLKEQRYEDFIQDIQHKRWRYCLIKGKDLNEEEGTVLYSYRWDVCEQQCCSTLSTSQCYFKAPYFNTINQQLVETNSRLLQTKQEAIVNSQQQKAQSKKSVQTEASQQTSEDLDIISESQDPSQDQAVGTTTTVLIILSCIFGIPFALLMFFGILSAVQMCRHNSRTRGETANQPVVDNIVEENINLDDYKIDQMGPYHINFQEQCSICLQQNVNIRTCCGHYYHPKCLKAWLMKAKHRCPVCNCTKLNPMKVYCKKCSIAVKLVVLNTKVSQQFLDETHQLECGNCGSDQGSDFSKSFERDQKEAQKKKPSQVQIDKNTPIQNKKDIDAQLTREDTVRGHNQNQIHSLHVRQSHDQLSQDT